MKKEFKTQVESALATPCKMAQPGEKTIRLVYTGPRGGVAA